MKILVTVLAALFTGGCASTFVRTPAASAVISNPVVATVATNTVTVTNIVATPTATNAVVTRTETITTNFVADTSRLVTNWVTNVVVTVAPAVTDTLRAAQGVAEAVPGYGNLISLGLGAVAGILGLVAKVKSDKAALVPALIAGVEAAGASAADVKKSIKTVATAAGLQPRLAVEVAKQTA